MPYGILPSINAGLNFASAVFLILGFVFAKQRAITAHTVCMLAACGTSTLFLTAYLYYHAHHGSAHFTGTGWIRPVYFTILISHTILAAAIVPLAIVTLARALRADFIRHVRIAKKTLPIWLYVSVTGVVIYWLLYHAYGPPVMKGYL